MKITLCGSTAFMDEMTREAEALEKLGHEVKMPSLNLRDSKGNEFMSKAIVYVLQDVDELGYLYLGDLDDIDSSEQDSPEEIKGAFLIRKFNKSPQLRSTTKFIRKAILG